MRSTHTSLQKDLASDYRYTEESTQLSPIAQSWLLECFVICAHFAPGLIVDSGAWEILVHLLP